MHYLYSIYNFITSSKAASIYIFLFALSIGIATFVENDYGTSAAQSIIFRAWWFEMLLMLFGLSLLANIYRFKLISQRKYGSLLFHFAMIIILIGAGITRYFGYEGVMHIRELTDANSFLSSETYLNFKITFHEKTYSFNEPVYFASLGNNKFKGKYTIKNKNIEVNLIKFIPNPIEQILEDSSGVPTLKLVVSGNSGREEYCIKKGDRGEYAGIRINFSEERLENFVNISYVNDSLFFISNQNWSQMVMATQQKNNLPANEVHRLLQRSLYSSSEGNFVISEFLPKAQIKLISKELKVKNESNVSLKMVVKVNDENQELLLTGRKGLEGEFKSLQFEDLIFQISYGSKLIPLPFSIYLKDFILDKYPGTDNPSSYASEVTLMDPSLSLKHDQRIYMNHILDYNGYRFFQSSYDPDEKGTYLSVNHDFWGTWISYIGYIMLTIGLILNFFLPNTRFGLLNIKLRELQKKTWVILLFLFIPIVVYCNVGNDYVISKQHADKFGKVLVQDFKGRFEPINTLANEVNRKLSNGKVFKGLSSEQVFLAMILDPQRWENEKLIFSGSHPKILKLLNSEEGLISYQEFFDKQGQYILKDQVRAAQTMNPKDQGVFEKAILKLDEKVNIANMVFSGRLLKIFPVINDANNTWISPAELEVHNNGSDSGFVSTFLPRYAEAISFGIENMDYDHADQLLNQLTNYQSKISGDILPSATKIKCELWLNEWNMFAKLSIYYSLLGLVLLIYFFTSVFNKRIREYSFSKWSFLLVAFAFFIHTVSLGLRWYVSGHAPWSNGYESMIYIAWTTVMAGLIFSRKSIGGMAATCILSSTLLLVAGLSYLDPEITPLVPVLKSYWLTIHVSLEAGSYGFLLLGAVVGMINLILMLISNKKNVERIKASIQELSIISEITVTGGLVMVSIGTYLGGVWANESWGRYWGWDAKETWALVTILVYAFILHMRFIPYLKSLYAYNFATLFGFATVIMTYYGVNYYLSGLHSYAAGDPVPIPPQVYYTTGMLTSLSIFAYIKYKKNFGTGLYI